MSVIEPTPTTATLPPELTIVRGVFCSEYNIFLWLWVNLQRGFQKLTDSGRRQFTSSEFPSYIKDCGDCGSRARHLARKY